MATTDLNTAMLARRIVELEAKNERLLHVLKRIERLAWPATGGVDREMWPGGEEEVFSAIATTARAAIYVMQKEPS